MAIRLTPADFKICDRAAHQATKRLVRQFGLPPCDCDEVYQSLFVDLLTRYEKGFDPERGCLAAFATVVVRHGAAGLATRLRRHRTLFAQVSLDDPISGGDGVSLGETFADADGYLARVGGVSDPIVALENSLSLERALQSLRANYLRLCKDLVAGSPAGSEGQPHSSRATHYRQLHDIRLCLLAAGLDPQLGGWS